MTGERCRGIFRELAHSPGRETDDALILRETARRLEERGYEVELATAEDVVAEPPGTEPPPFLFVMCERLPILERLAAWEARGSCAVNPSAGIRNTYRDRTAAIFAGAGVPFPASTLVSTSDAAPLSPSGGRDLKGLWIKRGDVHATEADDVVRAAGTDEALEALAALGRRGVSRALLQEHVPGDLVKFYGVGDAARSEWFEWFYHRDQVLARHPFDPALLEKTARRAAAALGLEVWGGDAIVGADGIPAVIDLNAWPSFALYRERAAAAIAAHLAERYRSHAQNGVAEWPNR